VVWKKRRIEMKRKLLKGFLILATISQVVYAGDLLAVDGPGAPPEKVTGTVDRIEDDSIQIRTDGGPMQSYSFSERRREEVRAFNEGDRVVVETDWMNRLVDIYPATVLFSSQAPGHRIITGKVVTFSRSGEKLTMETRSGETETFEVKDPALRKMGFVKKGSHVTVELDDQNRVTDVHRG
jgi:hypothetical protein